MEVWSALAIGFFGSFHCVGMCGPIALALPGKNDLPIRLIWGRMLYNVGRVITYSFLGLLFGLVGKTITIADLQQTLSIFLGIVIVTAALFQLKPSDQWKTKLGLNTFYKKVEQRIRNQFQKKGMATLLIIGLLNGLLPCGFVYVGLAGAVTTGSILQSGLFMALFGLGTLPTMMLMALAPEFISLAWRQRINKWIPYLAAAFGIYLIIRGIVVGEMLH
jgi:sulfite exporter TauE/SafE